LKLFTYILIQRLHNKAKYKAQQKNTKLVISKCARREIYSKAMRTKTYTAADHDGITKSLLKKKKLNFQYHEAKLKEGLNNTSLEPATSYF